MPPSGFSQKAINGLLEFVEANYAAILREYLTQNTLCESDFLRETQSALEKKVRDAVNLSPLKIDESGTQGLVTFLTSCYSDLVDEIVAGQDKYGREVVDGRAIQKELNQIGSYLKEFKI